MISRTAVIHSRHTNIFWQIHHRTCRSLLDAKLEEMSLQIHIRVCLAGEAHISSVLSAVGTLRPMFNIVIL